MRFSLLLISIISCLYSTPFNFERSSEIEEENHLSFPAPALSIIIPGGTQFIAREPLRGTLFIGFEALLGGIAIDRHRRYRSSYESVNLQREVMFELLSHEERDLISIEQAESSYRYAKTENFKWRMLHRNYSAWTASIWGWNIIDAIGYTTALSGVDNPDPRRAMLLSAIPFTGAGQLYNGEPYKAGLVSAVQLGCMISALNFQRLADYTEREQERLNENPIYEEMTRRQNENLKKQYDDALRSRTMFMWYGIMFYIYGMLDAYTDAHLFNFNDRFELYSSSDPVKRSVTTGVAINF